VTTEPPARSAAIDPTRSAGIDLDFFHDRRIAGLLGAVVALSGELLVLKAQVRRLTAALEAGGTIDDVKLAQAGDSAALQAWIAQEAEAQARAVLRPILVPDEAADVRHLMTLAETQR
jgi:hypothetical protein